MKIIKKKFSILLSLFFILFAQNIFAVESKDPIKLTLHDWTGQLITTNIMAEVLKKAGNNVELVQADYIAQFAGLQTIYKHYMDGRLPRVKIQSKKGSKQRFNQEHVEVEIRKELSHDGTYHKDELTKFYSIPSTNEQEVRQCLSSSQLYTAIYGSVASSPDFENMLSKRTKNRIFDTVRWYLINNRKNIKTQFDISTSRHTTDVVEDSASVLE